MFVKVLVFSLFFNLMITGAFAEESRVDYYKNQIRPTFTKIFGEELTDKILGPKPFEIKLPKIPEMVSNTKELEEEIIDKNKDSLSSEDKRKYDYIFIQELFEATKGPKASDSDISKWLNVLDQGGTREGVYRSIVLDSTYGDYEKAENPINDTIIEFTLNYMGTYINQTVAKEALEKINFYSLKRIVVEKTLDVVDLLALQKNNDLAAWYAVFSSDIAEKYPAFWQGKIRQDKSKKVHYEWAQNVPIQHVKGEIILKLNKILNQLR